jgi:hypothetical protein
MGSLLRNRRTPYQPAALPGTLAAAGGGKAALLARAPGQGRLGRDRGEQLEQLGDEPRPSGLVAGADAGAVVAVRILVEAR